MSGVSGPKNDSDVSGAYRDDFQKYRAHPTPANRVELARKISLIEAGRFARKPEESRPGRSTSTDHLISSLRPIVECVQENLQRQGETPETVRQRGKAYVESVQGQLAQLNPRTSTAADYTRLREQAQAFEDDLTSILAFIPLVDAHAYEPAHRPLTPYEKEWVDNRGPVSFEVERLRVLISTIDQKSHQRGI